MKRKTVVAIALGIALAIAAIAAVTVVLLRSDKASLIGSPTGTTLADDSSTFVTVKDGEFMLAGRPYHFAGANFWQGMNMGASGPTGDRDRLVRELEHLKQLGITNLRVMAASEGPNSEPQRIRPALMTSPGVYNENVLDGLDYLLAEMGKLELRAVLVLNNYWQWTGGMAQYVSWHYESPIPYPGDWNEFMAYSAQFFTCDECQTWYRDHIAYLVGHTNRYTHTKYRDDLTIFSWELANEPRDYLDDWIDDTAAYIKSLDPNHLVTTGSEGNPTGTSDAFKRAHDGPNIDYATIHIWPQNWGWYEPLQASVTARYAGANAEAFLGSRTEIAAELDKPLVLEEFGLARDWEPLNDIYDARAPTTYRDRFYELLLGDVYASASSGGPLAGFNFWAWSGEARPGNKWIGDPPHETPGWYSVYKTDKTTETIISTFARAMNRLPAKSDAPVSPA